MRCLLGITKYTILFFFGKLLAFYNNASGLL